ncbi:MAG: hypothetical protein IJD06_09585 [Clostridia bacterium]|nr:hypothetical protein [Clostridia bacterium]
MKKIFIADVTMAGNPAAGDFSLTFREKTELARSLDRMCADVIEFAPIVNEKIDTLLVRTAAPIVKESIICQRTGYTVESVDVAWNAVSSAAKKRISITFPLSSAQMEFICHMKPKAIAEAVPAMVTRAKTYLSDVEFCALDATRAEYSYLTAVLASAIEAGATTVTVCDTASVMMPDEFAAFVEKLRADVPGIENVRLGVQCSNGLGVGLACAIAAIKAGADEIKCATGIAAIPSEKEICAFMKNRGDSYGVSCTLKSSEISRITSQIEWLVSGKKNGGEVTSALTGEENIVLLDASADSATVAAAVRKLGYDLTEEDNAKVFEAFQNIAQKKPVGVKELEAIVATTALQVPPTYKLVSYVVNNGNIIPATAQIQLEKGDQTLSGVCIGDGPIDAAFLAIEQIIGHHYELDAFQIQAVTEGREAVGSALIRLRSGGKLYSGNGISTDIIGASIRAYLSALNKIVHEEA